MASCESSTLALKNKISYGTQGSIRPKNIQQARGSRGSGKEIKTSFKRPHNAGKVKEVAQLPKGLAQGKGKAAYTRTRPKGNGTALPEKSKIKKEDQNMGSKS
jgi:hypothetical protein